MKVYHVNIAEVSRSADCVDGEHYNIETNPCEACELLEPGCALCKLSWLEMEALKILQLAEVLTITTLLRVRD